MNTKKILINTLVVLLLLVAVWFGYNQFFGGDDTADGLPSVTSNNPAGTVSSVDGSASEFLVLLSQLRNVTLDASFLTEQTFSVSLQNYTTTLPTRAQGRQNPFANFGVGNVNVSSDDILDEPITETEEAEAEPDQGESE